MDCEMVGVGPEGEESILARCSLVNQFGKCIYDKFVRPTEKVTDYRTKVSGIRPEDINEGQSLGHLCLVVSLPPFWFVVNGKLYSIYFHISLWHVSCLTHTHTQS